MESKNEFGGLKEGSLSIEGGSNAYQKLKHEAGVHRVQRVPINDTKIQTSAATVAILPEPDNIDVNIDMSKDLKFDVFRASGAGGQHVNTTESAVRCTHLPTGITVSIQDERSQHKNKDKAIKLIRAKVYDHVYSEQQALQSSTRKSQVGSGDRSERIRTYNFSQDRITDHRISMSKNGVEKMLNGGNDVLDEIILGLREWEDTEKMKQLLEENE